jgi:very-short-patch-repair endonuclease
VIPVDGIITDQEINPEKLERAKELRSHMTPEEKILWGHLRANRTGGFNFRRQQVIDGYIVDFYCHKASLVIEVDGLIHLAQRQYDRERDEQLKSRGLIILRFTNDEVKNKIDEVLEKIRSIIIPAC